MKKNSWLAGYLTLSRKERTGVLLIGVLVLTLFLLPSLLPRHSGKAVSQADTAWIMAMKRLEQQEESKSRYHQGEPASGSSSNPGKQQAYSKQKGASLFYFDPNTLDEEGWQDLGLREKTIKTILNYVAKGGRFHKPEDLHRIYGLFPDEYERLAPYIRIEEQGSMEQPGKNTGFAKVEKSYPASAPGKITDVEINTADTTAFIALPGIGSKLAGRIVHFREKLGGFYSIAQLGETFGLADSVFQKIKPRLKLQSLTLRRININTATAEELKVHPYLKWNIINALLAYRKEHGPFRKKEELKQVMAVTDEMYQRIAPYLVTE
jgi:competence ComEA-like helix-hairpin-helix protein